MLAKNVLRHRFSNLIRYRPFATQESTLKRDPEWENALPFEKIPGPGRYELIRGFLKGGVYYNLPIVEMHRALRSKYGDILVLPGMLGRDPMLLTFSPVIFEKVFRTEGQYPRRRGLETFIYYRKNVRPEVFGDTGGLLTEHGEKWFDVRSKVNPVMLQPKTVKMYVEKTDQVARDFIDHIRTIRSPQSLEVENSFGHELNRWALESISVIALDERLGSLSSTEQKQKLINLVKEFFILSYELDVALSLWKYCKTPKFSRLMNVFDEMTEIIMGYIDNAMKRLAASDTSSASDRSVLEKLLMINRQVAIVMAFDMILAGVDTTSAALTSCLYHLARNPDKQETLREEVRKMLPQKDSNLTNESLNSLPYMRACLKEALRLNPVIAGNARTSGRDIVLNGYQVPKGIEVAMATVVLQNDDAYYPITEDFIPERWLKENEQEAYAPTKLPSNSFVFLPFGFGPRSCIGRRFAEMEIFVLLTRIIREFKIEYNHGPLKYKTSIILSPNENTPFKFVDVEN